MAIDLYSFTPNTKAESAKVNTNFLNVKEAHERGLKDIVTDTDQATITFDMSDYNIHTVTLADNRNLAVTGVEVGQPFFIRLIQDVTGGRTVTWWSGIKWPSGSVPPLSTTGGSIDGFMFICTGSGAYDGYFAGFDLR